MKLYLSSYYLGNHPEELAKLVGTKKNVGIIMNAVDIYGDEKRPEYLANEVMKFKALGLNAEELDLRKYFEDNTSLTKKLNDYGLIWAMGGNTFVLRRAMRMSGFDQIISDLVYRDSIVYGGFSAGSVVATKTLRGIELVDDSEVVPDGYNKEIVWEGLGFVDFSIAPHYQSNHPETEAIEKVVKYFETEAMPYKALHDGEAVVVVDDSIEILA
ncbi:MAG: Type 1 glutamine amidotransferase-like domain-containing protein [bacterium]